MASEPSPAWQVVPLGFKHCQLWRNLVVQCFVSTEAIPKALPIPPFLPSPMGWGPRSNPDPLRTRVPFEGCKPIPPHAFLQCKGHGTGRLWNIRRASTQSHHAATATSLDVNSSGLPHPPLIRSSLSSSIEGSLGLLQINALCIIPVDGLYRPNRH